MTKLHTFETVALIHIEDEKLLLTRDFGSSAFLMPGGKIEKGEDYISALIRETQEELGVLLDPKTISFFHAFTGQAFAKPHGVHVKIHCFLADFTGSPQPSTEIEELKLFSSHEYFAMQEQAPVGILIFDYLKKKGLVA